MRDQPRSRAEWSQQRAGLPPADQDWHQMWLSARLLCVHPNLLRGAMPLPLGCPAGQSTNAQVQKRPPLSTNKKSARRQDLDKVAQLSARAPLARARQVKTTRDVPRTQNLECGGRVGPWRADVASPCTPVRVGRAGHWVRSRVRSCTRNNTPILEPLTIRALLGDGRERGTTDTGEHRSLSLVPGGLPQGELCARSARPGV